MDRFLINDFDFQPHTFGHSGNWNAVLLLADEEHSDRAGE
jgi:hypothetical protein